MGVMWTEDQRKVIELRDRNILVSAAAGSGKTAVLVERIMEIVCDETHPVDVDRLLVVTFTKAAAAEMKERVGAAIRKRLEEQPNNGYLQKQETLVSHAQITTIDSFCSYILRNHFGEIDLDPAFRVADEGELKLLKKDILKELLEEEYAKKRPEFLRFVECYASGKNDDVLEDLILKEFKIGLVLGLFLSIINFIRLLIYFAIPAFRQNDTSHTIIPYQETLFISLCASFAL